MLHITNCQQRGSRFGLVSLFACALVQLGACVKVAPLVVDQQAQIENQLVGQLERLEATLVLASSVRGTAAEASNRKADSAPLAAEARRAALVRAFLADDIRRFKQSQLVGEGRNGELVVLGAAGSPGQARVLRQIVQDENAARHVLWRRALQLSPGLDGDDSTLVQLVFHRLVVRTAIAGDRVQREDGHWETIAAPQPAKRGP